MSDLARPIGTSSKAKVLLVRQPVRSVRPGDLPSPAAFRLALATVCAAGGVGLLWLLGHVGFRLGFAESMGMPQLLAEPGQGLAGGVRQLLASPLVVFRAGLAEPLLLIIGFPAIAIPAAALAAARPPRPGGPRPSRVELALSALGGAGAIVLAVTLLAWAASPLRAAWLAPLPESAADGTSWLGGLDKAAGADGLALAAAVLWTVLVFRLAIPSWLRALAAATIVAATVVTALSWSVSSATAVEVLRDRPIVDLGQGRGGGLVLGYTPGQVVLLRRVEDRTLIDLQSGDAPMRVVRRASVADLLEAG